LVLFFIIIFLLLILCFSFSYPIGHHNILPYVFLAVHAIYRRNMVSSLQKRKKEGRMLLCPNKSFALKKSQSIQHLSTTRTDIINIRRKLFYFLIILRHMRLHQSHQKYPPHQQLHPGIVGIQIQDRSS